MVQPQGKGGRNLTNEDDQKGYLVARNGDHLIIPFQRHLCHFRNMRQIDPEKNNGNVLLLMMKKRVSMDALFFLKPSMV